MIEDILTADAVQLSSKDVTIREMIIRMDPVIKRKFHPLNNPDTILAVLQGILPCWIVEQHL